MRSKLLLLAQAVGFFIILLLIANSCQTSSGKSNSYPTKPITYIVPWAPGGMTDMSSRMMAATLQKAIGRTVNVVNRTGGGGVVGHLALSQAKPDGYTLGAVTVEITQLHHMGLTDLTYKNYTPLALKVNNAAAITVNINAPWNNIQELIDHIRANPGDLQASGTARGGIWDLARLGFLEAVGFKNEDMPWVPSQGSAPALQELLADGIDVVTTALSEVEALRKAGQVKTLAVMSPERLPSFPDVPTLKEQGIDWSIGGWVSVCAPAGLPEDIRMTLDSVLNVASHDPSFVQSLTKAGSTLQYLNSQDLADFMKSQDELKGQLMKNSGLTPQ